MSEQKLPLVGASSAAEPHPLSEETPAPHLQTAEEEVWTLAPFDAPAARSLTAEERWPGEWHAICWMYAHGSSQQQIARELGYSESRISVILNKPQVHEKIERIRREFIGTESLSKKFSSVAPKAADFLSGVIMGKEDSKLSERIDASKWMLEKVTGKPKQEVALDGGTTILQLLQALDAAKTAGEALSPRSVTEADIELTAQKPDPLRDWVTAHVPDYKSEKDKS